MEKILSKSYSMYFTLSYNNTPDYKFCMSLSKKKGLNHLFGTLYQ